jgi:gliding motility-associated lipoprotein GldH
MLLLLVAVSCDNTRVFEEYQELNGSWPLTELKTFQFTIKDTAQMYNIKGAIRNHKKYPYYNLYVKYKLTRSDEVVLDDLKEIVLFEPKTGKPFGSGLGDVYDHEFSLIEDFTFSEPGDYSLIFTQFMRMDTLVHLERIGARVERVTQE